MHKITHVSVSTPAERLFNFFMLLYPNSYQKQYGNEMRLVFVDMYQEELAKNGKVGVGFWLSQIEDITGSVLEQHVDEIKRKGMKKYLQQTMHINKYNTIGFFFLSPFLLLFAIDVVSRIAQGDLAHYNRPVYHYLSQTPLYWTPVLFTIAIIFPLLAVMVNVFSVLISIRKKKKIAISKLVIANPFSVIIIALGLFFLLIIFGHDFIPCTVHGLLKLGVGQVFHIVSICRNA